MLNLIRMNFYRMSHSVSTWVILITMVVFMGLTVVTNCVLMKNLVNSDGTMKIESSESITEESTTTENTAEMVAEAYGHKITINSRFQAGVQGGDLLIFLAIFTVIFVHAEEKNGFIKNIACRTKHKWDIFLAKLPVIACYTLVCILLYFVLNTVIMKIWFPHFELGIEAKTFVIFGLELLLYFGYMALCSMLIVVSKNSAIGMTFSLIPIFGIGMIVIKLLNFLIKHDVDLNKYTLIGNLASISTEFANSDLVRALIVAVVWFVIWIAISMLTTEKRDVI